MFPNWTTTKTQNNNKKQALSLHICIFICNLHFVSYNLPLVPWETFLLDWFYFSYLYADVLDVTWLLYIHVTLLKQFLILKELELSISSFKTGLTCIGAFCLPQSLTDGHLVFLLSRFCFDINSTIPLGFTLLHDDWAILFHFSFQVGSQFN